MAAALILLLAIFSLADRTQTAWFAVRTLGFLAAALYGRFSLGYLAAAFGLGAIGGFAALDPILALLAYSAFRPGWRVLSWVAGLAGVSGALSLTWTAIQPEWPFHMFPFHNRNHYAVFCELTLPVLLYTWRRHKNEIFLGLAVAMVLAALAGGSRTGTVILAAECILLTFALKGRKWLPVVVASLVVAAFCVALHNPERLINPLQGDHRLDIWKSGLAMLQANPFGGWGAHEFSRVYPAYALFDNGEFVNAAHSDWLEWATEYGILAPIALFAALVLWAKKLIRFYPSWGILMGALHASVDFPFHMPGLMLFTVALAGTIHHHAEATQTQPANPSRRSPEVPEQ